MTSDASRQRWIEAAKILGVDPTARVARPRCLGASLQVTDVHVAGSRVFERHLACPDCGERNVMRMTYKGHEAGGPDVMP